MARVTLADVADEAGVSKWTASIVLNGLAEENRLSAECAVRVETAARELGYLANYHARTLSRGKAMTLGFISRYNERDIMRPVIESGFTAEANEHGYEMLSLTAPDGEQAIRRAARYVQQGRIDGFAVFSGVPPDSRITDEIPPSVPLVHVWFYEGLLYPVVTLDPAPGLEQAVSHLVDMGHKRLAWLGLQGPEGPGAPDRLQAVRDAAGTHGIEITERFIAPRQQALGHSASVFYEKLSGKLDTLEEATAVLCYNDALAVGLCVALREAGLRVPEDVSVVGFDDVQAVHAVPRLTTVSHCFAEMGRAAVRHLDELIESGEERSEEAILVPSRLVVRESTAPAPRARGEDAT